MSAFPPWPAVATLAVGVANLVLLRYLWPWREEPGGRWFLAVIGLQVLWCVTYGVGLLVFDPTLRLALELLTWLPINWIGVFFLAFALEYTGRVDLLRSGAFLLAVGFEVVSTALVLTNPLHQFVWTGFEIAPVFGAATVTYTNLPWVFVQYIALFAFSTLGIFLLLDTVISYGPLFRKQALAIALTPLAPAGAFTAWVFGLGPAAALNLTPLMFLPHMLLDMYALFRKDMFEFKPATRRAGERAAIEDLATPVVITDRQGRVITLNGAARETFAVTKRAVLAEPLGSLYEGDEIAVQAGTQAVGLRVGGTRREFDVAVTTLADAAGRQVGYTITFQDVTAERQRKQRLEVLNRILRHNLRNDLGVVINYADLIAAGTDDPAGHAGTIERKAAELVELGEKARRAETALEGDRERREIQLQDVLSAVVTDVREQYPSGTVVCTIPDSIRVESDRKLLDLVVGSLLENALEHGAGRVELAAVGVADDGHSVLLTITDDGPGIPDHELSVVEGGEETPLAHGSGMGLWLVSWGMTSLGGEVSFETPAEGGTVVTLRLPGLVAGDVPDDRTA